MDVKRCETCAAFSHGALQCRRRAPPALSQWANVAPGDWCLEWTPAPTVRLMTQADVDAAYERGRMKRADGIALAWDRGFNDGRVFTLDCVRDGHGPSTIHEAERPPNPYGGEE